MKNIFLLRSLKLFALTTLLATPSFAQKNGVVGNVVDEKGQPISGVLVSLEKDDKTAVFTDRAGYFKIDSKIGDRLNFESLDNRVALFAVKDSIIQVVLNPQAKSRAIGQDISHPEWEMVGAISSVDELDFHRTPIDPSNVLFGKIPGLQVLQTQGNSWSDGAKLFIRGMETTNGKSPLILVDGLERSISNLTAQEIESVSVIKDGPSLSLYGLRGSNGVVLITTKRGYQAKPEISLSYEMNMGRPYKTPEFVDAPTYARALNEALVNDGRDPRYNSAELAAYESGEYPDFYPNVNWWDHALRKYSFGDNINFSLRGGGKIAKYFTQLNFLDDRGILGPTHDKDGNKTQFKYSKLNVRTNLDIELTSTTNLAVNILGNISEHNRPGFTGDDIFNALFTVPSGAFPIKTENGVWGGTKDYANNPIAMINGSGYARSQTRTLYADFTLRQDLKALLKGLSMEITTGIDHSASYWDSNTKNFGYEDAIYNWEDPSKSTYKTLREESALSFGTNTGSIDKHFNFKGRFIYENRWNDHRLKATAGYSMDKTTNKGRNNTFSFIDLHTYLHYVYKNRYIVDASVSGSASSVLDPDDKWGVFPSVGASWIMSEESFMKTDWLNMLKARASFGLAGYANYGVNLYKDRFGGGNGYFFKDNLSGLGGSGETQLKVNGLTYEKSHKYNIGFDAVMFDKLSLTFDAFYAKRTDILVQSSGLISSVLGIQSPFVNNGEVQNKGFEVDARWSDKVGNVSYEVGGNFSLAKNKIKNMNEVYRPHDYLKRTNQSLGQMFGYEVIGIYKDQAEIDNRGVAQNLSEVKPGDLMFKDQNGDGRIDEYDMIAMGYNTNCPEIYYGFDLAAEYKGIGIYAQFQGVDRFSKWLDTKSIYRPIVSNNTISKEYYNNRWTPENLDAKYPRLTAEGSKNNFSNNSKWLADAAYLKLRTLEVYYKLPSSWLAKSPLKSAKIYARGHDLLRFTKMKIQDPEGMGTLHPLMKEVVFGVNVLF